MKVPSAIFIIYPAFMVPKVSDILDLTVLPELTEQIENPDSYDVIFLKNQFLADMFLTTRFIFFDFERPFPLFFVEYLAIIGLFVSLAHYGTRGFQKMAE